MTVTSGTPDPARTSAGRVSGVLTVESLRELYVHEHGPLPKLSTALDSSREVSWAAAHEQLWPVVDRGQRHGDIPIIGTPAWCELPDGDPIKVAAVYAAADQFALHLENLGTALVDASHSVSGSADWSSVARRNNNIAAFYREHPDLRRRSA
ncbi:DUF2742 domain-containing protein [Williamsia sterculiae]|uniref:DUF2742 domain-containing protein n=1 Tax=Williamsia sterculiae TaxID=1344003 RepID=A0A1N7HBT5_9NOCA|nr:DUF2742 domain-containing protein [Williamsia sterculiae]SIS22211.1 Protein of unknown function [Williamsia sterculiae]